MAPEKVPSANLDPDKRKKRDEERKAREQLDFERAVIESRHFKPPGSVEEKRVQDYMYEMLQQLMADATRNDDRVTYIKIAAEVDLIDTARLVAMGLVRSLDDL